MPLTMSSALCAQTSLCFSMRVVWSLWGDKPHPASSSGEKLLQAGEQREGEALTRALQGTMTGINPEGRLRTD